LAVIATNTATTTSSLVTTQTNQGTQLSVTPQSSTSTVGNFVTDISTNPYIQSTVVKFSAVNLRPNTRVHAFFDGQLVDQYCTTATLVGTNDGLGNNIDQDNAIGTPLVTDSRGQIYGCFFIPGGVFKSGDRVFELTDTSDLVRGIDAMTTVASSTLTAEQYISVTKQALTLTTINPQMSFTPVTNTVTTNTYLYTTNTVVNTYTVVPDTVNLNYSWYEPLAQALTINTPNKEPGIFATSLDLYFQQKPDTSLNHGCSVYICETNNGYPDGTKIVPYSSVHLDVSSINVDPTAASVATNFKFPSPVYLSSNAVYAFVVKPDGGDPDYHVWTANLGNVDVLSGSQVTSQPALGTAFYGSTTKEWTALQTEYVKFNLNIANFTSLTGDAYLENQDQEFIAIQNLQYQNTSTSIFSGDYVYQSTNSTLSTAQTAVYGIVDHYDGEKNVIYVNQSNGGFSNNGYVQVHRLTASGQTPNSTTYIAGANVYLLYNPIVDAVAPQFAHIEPSGTKLSYDFTGTSNTFVADSSAIPITMGTETSFYDYERRVLSYSQEQSLLSGNKSASVHVNFLSDSFLVSPVIDLVKANLFTIRNFVDPLNSIYEEFYNTGSARTKYISRVVTLAQNQDSEDLNIIVSAYRPPGTDVQVWVKFLNGQDPESMSNKTWTPMRNTSPSLYCDPSNPNDFKEFSYSVPYGYPLIPTTGTVTSTTSSNTITGTSTLFGYEVFPGWYINFAVNNFVGEVSRKVISVTSNTSMILDGPFNSNHTNEAYYVVPPPTSAWSSANNYVQVPGTVTTSTTNNSIIGSGTSFTQYFTPGSIISTANDSQQVVSVANDTYLTVGTPWTTAASGATASIRQNAGLTYKSSSGGLFSTFKQFQIKVILQSNDSTKVPLIDNLRAMALQL